MVSPECRGKPLIGCYVDVMTNALSYVVIGELMVFPRVVNPRSIETVSQINFFRLFRLSQKRKCDLINDAGCTYGECMCSLLRGYC